MIQYSSGEDNQFGWSKSKVKGALQSAFGGPAGLLPKRLSPSNFLTEAWAKSDFGLTLDLQRCLLALELGCIFGGLR